MRFVDVIALLVAARATMSAQSQLPADRPVRSVTGQFIVRDARPAAAAAATPGAARTNQSLLALEPSFLAVSCERIKQALYSNLGVTADRKSVV
jgi:hypothetical protein